MSLAGIALWYLLVGALTFVVYGVDKAAAVSGDSRIPEALLHLLGFAGGWPGALVAQLVFHHKSRKTPFRITFRIVALLNTAAVLLILPVVR